MYKTDLAYFIFHKFIFYKFSPTFFFNYFISFNKVKEIHSTRSIYVYIHIIFNTSIDSASRGSVNFIIVKCYLLNFRARRVYRRTVARRI